MKRWADGRHNKQTCWGRGWAPVCWVSGGDPTRWLSVLVLDPKPAESSTISSKVKFSFAKRSVVLFELRTIMLGLISLNASMTTFPFTDWMGSTTTATALRRHWRKGLGYQSGWSSHLSDKASKLCCVLMSTPDSQQPKPGWEWYLLLINSFLFFRVRGVWSSPADHHLWPAGLF